MKNFTQAGPASGVDQRLCSVYGHTGGARERLPGLPQGREPTRGNLSQI